MAEKDDEFDSIFNGRTSSLREKLNKANLNMKNN